MRNMQIKVIFIRMVLHLDSLCNRVTRELGNGLLGAGQFIELILSRDRNERLNEIDLAFSQYVDFFSTGSLKIQLRRKGKSSRNGMRVTARKIEAEEFVGNFTLMFQSMFTTPSVSVSWKSLRNLRFKLRHMLRHF